MIPLPLAEIAAVDGRRPAGAGRPAGPGAARGRRAGGDRLAAGRARRPVRRPGRRARRRPRLRRRRALARGAVAALVVATGRASSPAVVVDDVEVAFGRLARAVRRRAPPTLTVVGVTGSSGKTRTKDLLAQVLGRLGPTVARRGVVQQRDRRAADRRCAVDEDTRYLVLEMGARGVGPPHLPDRDRAAGRRGRAQRRVRARRRVRLARGHRRGQGRAGRRRSRRRASRCSTPTTRPCAAMAGGTAAPRRPGRPRPRRDVRAEDVALDGRPGRRFDLVSELPGAAAGRRSSCRCTASTRSATRSPRPRSALRARACRSSDRRRARRRDRGQPLADGGHRAPRRRHGRQRRLQRQPGLDARGAGGAGRDGRRRGAPGRCSARCSSSATTRDRGARRASAGSPADSGISRLVVVGAGARAAYDAGAGAGRLVDGGAGARAPTSTRRTTLLRPSSAAATSCW